MRMPVDIVILIITDNSKRQLQKNLKCTFIIYKLNKKDFGINKNKYITV